MKELKEDIVNAFDNYKYRKVGKANISDDTDFEIYKEIDYVINRFNYYIDELDSTIDAIMEDANEPSLYEQDLLEDERQRTLDLKRGV